MPIAFVSASTPQTGGAQNLVVNMPSGLVVGNYVFVFLRHSSQTGATTHAAAVFTAAAGLNCSNNLAVWYRKIDGSEAASYTFTAAAVQTISDAVAVQYSGVIGSGSPLDQAATGRDLVGSVNSVALAVTTTVANAMLLYADARNAASRTLSSTPSGMTHRTPNPTTFGIFDALQAVAGASGSKQATLTASSLHFNILLALKPSGDASVAAVTATGTAAAPVPAVTASSSVAATTSTGTAAAPAPTVGIGASVPAVPATATGTAHAPTVTADSSVAAVPATATTTAYPPDVGQGAELEPPPAQGTAQALPPSVSATASPTVAPPTAGGTALAPTPTVTAAAVLEAATAIATALAHAPALLVGATVTAPAATASGQAYPPEIDVPYTVPRHPTGAVKANRMTASITPNRLRAELS